MSNDKLPTRADNYSEWYNELVYRAGLADNSPVKGCMVIKPYGYAIWEKMQAELDRRFKETGHQNAYFPLFIPKSFLSKEAEHVEGFAKECAVVTHHRLRTTADGKGVEVDPDAKLEEELIVRPTSETIIWHTYKDWIQSYRDLPLLINQWANVVRWELRTRMFLRTAEFLWQEGHTAHASEAEAIEEAERMLHVYGDFAEQFMAMPVIRGIKTASERFAGAIETYCIEAMMQDGKALQAGTSHYLGQNFAKAFDVTFLNTSNQREHVYATSWGVSTRLMGALIMTHSDDKGLVLPPTLAPIQVVIVPIYKNDEEKAAVLGRCEEITTELRKVQVTVKIDSDDSKRPGWKYAEWELKGVPVRIALGPKDLAAGNLEIFRRDKSEKEIVPQTGITERIQALLADIQTGLYARAEARLKACLVEVNDYTEFKRILEQGTAPGAPGGFLYAHWDGTAETEALIKEETKATIRCIPLTMPAEPGTCIRTGKPSARRVIFAQAY